ncbi:dephospho-CoA kinase [Silvibacterium acidisoli]|uniref:dephospho-CoA kinase n=1 Tax=Acidobacteriaceae bacterium ZG23-2 TaxID=2883246 RepID=UPI00406C77BA
MLRVGLTGGLGSGKSTVAAIFRTLGAHVIEADEIGRTLMSPGHDVYDAIVNHFGPEVVRPDGQLDRKRLADLSFRQHRLPELNRLVHPAVIAAQQAWAERLFVEDPAAIAMVESALIFEADTQGGSLPGWRERFDRIVLVTAPEDMRIERYVARVMQNSPELSIDEVKADARRRLAQQKPDSEKIPLADYVIRNDGDLESARLQTAAVYAQLQAISRN